jgi:hypothetical protein
MRLRRRRSTLRYDQAPRPRRHYDRAYAYVLASAGSLAFAWVVFQAAVHR